jgi:hypothetical protein
LSRITELKKSIDMIVKNISDCIKKENSAREIGIYHRLLVKNIEEKRKEKSRKLKSLK